MLEIKVGGLLSINVREVGKWESEVRGSDSPPAQVQPMEGPVASQGR